MRRSEGRHIAGVSFPLLKIHILSYYHQGITNKIDIVNHLLQNTQNTVETFQIIVSLPEFLLLLRQVLSP